MNFRIGILVLAAICVMSSMGIGQRNFGVGIPVTENFDTLGTATVAVTDNGPPIVGFYAFGADVNTNPHTFFADDGSIGISSFYNLGTTGAADRTAGSIPGLFTGTTYLGLRLLNVTSDPITSITVTYTGEQWRSGSTGPEVLAFSYQTGATVTSLTAGTWVTASTLDFTSPNNAGGFLALDGNLAANRATITQTIAVNIPANSEIMLRWENVDDGGVPDFDHALGIDDLTVTAISVVPTAADATITGRVTDGYGRAISSAAITVQDFNGTTKVVLTNTFGYYRIEGLEAGQTYVLSVSSRRHTFANASMVINLGDNFDGANFVASR